MERALKLLAKFPPGLLVAAAAVAGLWVWSGSPTAAHRIPELEGLDVNEAAALAAHEGFETAVEFQEGGGRAGTVVGQDPAPHQVRNKGATVTLLVTQGAHQVQVPDVTSMPADEARAELLNNHLRTGDVVYRDDPTREANRVITTEPPPGTTVDVDTEVTIIVAS
jgi:eukaryotic-like serine/threonine-protein kinase